MPDFEGRSKSDHGATILQWLLAGLLATALLLNGLADLSMRPPLTILLTVVAGLGLLLPIKNGPVRPMICRALFLCIGLALWVGLQSLRLPLWLPVHPIWHDLATTLGTDYGYLSVNPSTTWRALPILILPILIFVTSVIITQDKALARRFWFTLTYVGLLVVVVCVMRQVLFPDSLVFSGQALRNGQFSGVFINRNVAAAAFGLTGFAVLGSLAIHLGQDQSLRKGRDKRNPSKYYWKYVFLGGALFLTAVCLILTRSRAGSLFSLVLILPCLFIIVRNGVRNQLAPVEPWRRRAVSIVVGLITLAIFLAAYGEPVLSRVETTKDDLRWCTWAATIDAIKDHLVFGTGLGTFYDIFPMYRKATCDGTNLIWLRAHNSFLELYLVLGLPSLFFAGAVIVSLGQTVSTGMRHRQAFKGVPIAMAGAIIFVGTHSLVDFPLQIPGIALYFAALMGAGTRLCMPSKMIARGRDKSCFGQRKTDRV
jgi:O-antigen ligase